MKIKQNSLEQRFNHLLSLVPGEDISVKMIIEALGGKGQAALLILLVLPSCLPIQIPGFSTLFGVILMFIGLRIAFGRHTWIPHMLLEKKVPRHILEKIAKTAIAITNKLSFMTSTRLVYIVNAPALHICHGLAVTILAFLLSLPLPIPLTNLFAAFPIMAFGLGLLEDDGLMICIAYVLFFICLGVFASLLFFGKMLFTLF